MIFFDIDGPDFLIFYLYLFLVIFVYAGIRIILKERALPVPNLPTTDPYFLAFIRAGRREAIKLATLVLISRGLIAMDKKSKKFKVTNAENGDLVTFPIEKAVLQVFQRRTPAYEVFHRKICDQACDTYFAELKKCNLVRNTAISRERLRVILVPYTLFLLVGMVGIIPLKGDPIYLWFLYVMVIVSLLAFFWMYRTPKTAVRTMVLNDLTARLSPGKKRGFSLWSKDNLYDQALYAGVFGLPYKDLPKSMRNIFDEPESSDTSSSSSLDLDLDFSGD